ncbi:hypothetical protein DBV15_06359 [Temnothorax longispinosus]|uniref:Uncharacterized protein n=1 Tax=Temnothorax longispinosus TaxID=300112 RepID=A0A4S2L206_9HYME|nr:hypothetical protein DBV15_06359 [Temnothorax longispinosus]
MARPGDTVRIQYGYGVDEDDGRRERITVSKVEAPQQGSGTDYPCAIKKRKGRKGKERKRKNAAPVADFVINWERTKTKKKEGEEEKEVDDEDDDDDGADLDGHGRGVSVTAGDGLLESDHLSSYNFSGYLSRHAHAWKESKYHVRVGGRTTNGMRSTSVNKKKELPSLLLDNQHCILASTYFNMHENLIDHAVANSATYRDAREEAKKEKRKREGRKGMEQRGQKESPRA